MKKLLIYITAIVFALMLANCEKTKGVETEITLELDPQSLSFDWNVKDSDQTVTATTNYEGELEVEVAYTDSERADWLDVAADGTTILVATTSWNDQDTQERPREATVTVKAGEVSKTFTVTQASYIETDFSMTASVTKLEFAAGNALEKTFTVETNAASFDVSDDADWLSTSVNGKTVTVTVVANTGEMREATITLTNDKLAAGEEVKVAVKQYGQVSLDLAGEWEWSSLSTEYNTRDDWKKGAETVSGTATITEIPGGFAVAGIVGRGAELALVKDNIDETPVMKIKVTGNVLSAGITESKELPTRPSPITIDVDNAFTTYDGSTQFCAAKALFWESATETIGTDEEGNPIYDFSDIAPFTGLDFPITMTTEEVDGEFYEVLTYPTTCAAPAEWADKGDGTISVTYVYYRYTAKEGSKVNPTPTVTYSLVDFHRNIVLKRKVSEN